MGPFFHPFHPERLQRPTKGPALPLPGKGKPEIASFYTISQTLFTTGSTVLPTRSRGPWKLDYPEPFPSLPEARRERQSKSWKSHRAIEQLIAGEKGGHPSDQVILAARGEGQHQEELGVALTGQGSDYIGWGHRLWFSRLAVEDAALIYGFMKIADRLTINGDADASYRLRMNGDSYLNGILPVTGLAKF